jgi:hypothetical protein
MTAWEVTPTLLRNMGMKIDKSAVMAIKHSLNHDSTLRIVEAREMFLRHMISSLDGNAPADRDVALALSDLYSNLYRKAHGKPPEMLDYESLQPIMTRFFFEGLQEVWPDAHSSAKQLLAWPEALPRYCDLPCSLVGELAWLLGHLEGERLSHNQNQA